MTTREMLMIFTYDVSRNKVRRKVSKRLEAVATRVQYSVFEGRMSQARADTLSQRIAALLETGDSLRVYAIGANGLRRSRVYGDGIPFEPDEDCWIF
jgi:CRISPR-associated protein Cas2